MAGGKGRGRVELAGVEGEVPREALTRALLRKKEMLNGHKNTMADLAVPHLRCPPKRTVCWQMQTTKVNWLQVWPPNRPSTNSLRKVKGPFQT